MLGLGSIAKKVFGSPNDRRVKAVRPLVEKINALEPQFRALTDAGIREKTQEFRDRIAHKGESLDDLLPEPAGIRAQAVLRSRSSLTPASAVP